MLNFSQFLREYLKDKPNTIDTPDWAEAKYKEVPKQKPGISAGKPNIQQRKLT